MTEALIGAGITLGIVVILVALYFFINKDKNNSSKVMEQELYQEIKSLISENQINALKDIQSTSNQNLLTITKTVQETLNSSSTQVERNVKDLRDEVQKQLDSISTQVEKRLSDGFDKTSDVFTKLIDKIAIIDKAQNKIKELSENVVQLQDVLSDKKSRGAFGEVQLNNIVKNILPVSQVYFQKDLSNGTRVDCLIKMPENNKDLGIDSKFPLENYKKMVDINQIDSEIKRHERAFKQDLKKHIDDIANKYIIEGETSENAIMFLPAEAIFAEIHAYHYDLVDYAQKKHIVLTSPNTLVALLTTIKSILKDEETKKQVHIIQKHLGDLAEDFDRFQKRVNDLTKHIKQANDDAEKVRISSDKISNRFKKIETVELDEYKPLIETPKEE